MCAENKPAHPPTWREGIRNVFSNWSQPLPFHVKLRLAAKNTWLRVKNRSTCCGNDGEPGC